VRILLVDPDTDRAATLARGLSAADMRITVAPSGSFALTMLEWNRHDVIVSRLDLGDMEGRELCTILRDDPGMKELRFALLAEPDDVSPDTAGIDAILPPTMSESMMAARLLQLVPREADDVVAGFAGSLDDVDVGGLARMIAGSGRTGYLLVGLPAGGGAVAFEDGRVVHAEFGDAIGGPAFATLIGAARREPGGQFCFVADRDGLRGTPRTVHESIDDLVREE
jgi:CheY-like chemotaxis protein